MGLYVTLELLYSILSFINSRYLNKESNLSVHKTLSYNAATNMILIQV